MSDPPRAVIAAPNHWSSVLQVGTHHIARALASEGWAVAYVSDPVSPFHVAAVGKADARERFRHWFSGSRLRDGVHSHVPGTLLSPRGPHLPGTGAIARSWTRLTIPSLQRELRRSGFGSPDLVWIDSVIFERLPDLVGAGTTVLRIADQAAGFARHHPAFDAMELALAQRADAVVYSAAQLAPHVARLAPKRAIHMPNGVDLARFRERAGKPIEYSSISSPRAVYVGAMAEWFDYALVDELVEKLPSVSFVLIGPSDVARKRLRPAANLYLLGGRPAAHIPALLQHADVGLIPFDVRGWPELIGAVNPIKLYEYLATGLPVVAAEWAEIKALDAPASLYRTADEARQQIEAAIKGPTVDAGAWLDGSDWRERLRPVLDALGLPGGPRRN